MRDPEKSDNFADIQFAYMKAKGEIERLKKGRWIAPIALIFFAFLAGLFLQLSFLAVPPANLKAEYCRGVADGAYGVKNQLHEQVLQVEANAMGQGYEARLVILNPAGQILESVVVSDTMAPPVPTGFVENQEGLCNEATQEGFQESGLRGPTDALPVTTTTRGGAGVPPVIK